MYMCCTVDPIQDKLAFQWYLLPEDQRDTKVEAKARADLDRCYDVIERALKGRTFILGDK